MRFLALFLLVVAYKFLTNLMHYFRIKKLQTYFSEFLEHKRSDMNLYRQEVLSLFEKAHVKDIKSLYPSISEIEKLFQEM